MNENTRRFAIPLVLISVVVIAAWRQDSQPRPSKSTIDPSWSELSASMDKMHAAMVSVGPSGDSDMDFVNLMLAHHQAANQGS